MSLAEVGILGHWGAKGSHVIVLYAEVLKEVSFAKGFYWCKVQDFDRPRFSALSCSRGLLSKGQPLFFLLFDTVHVYVTACLMEERTPE